MRGARAWALAVLLVACAGPARPPPAEPAPRSAEQERFERWKQQGTAGDPGAGFSRAAEQEAERRRREALEKGEALRNAQPEPEPGGEAASDGAAESGR